MLRSIAVVLISLSSLAIADEAAPPPSAGSAAPPPSGAGGGGLGFGARAYTPQPVQPVTRDKLPVPKPPAEVTALAKELAGTWSCSGFTSASAGPSTSFLATITHKTELNGAWIVTTLAEKKGPMQWTQYTTFEPGSKQWRRFQMTNTTNSVLMTSQGEQGGEWLWMGATSMGGPPMRTHEQKDAKGWKLWGEVQGGGGRDWIKTFEAHCEKKK